MYRFTIPRVYRFSTFFIFLFLFCNSLTYAATDISIISPTDGAAVATNPVTVKGSVTEESTVTVNGQIASKYWTSDVSLVPGNNTITASAPLTGGGTIDATIHVI